MPRAPSLFDNWLIYPEARPPRVWFDGLDYDAKTGNFEYSAVHKESGRRIVVLKGNARDHKQPERNRARAFVYRLVDTLNVCAR